MLERQVVIPTSAEQLWDALTEPEQVATWFGSQVEWDLRPGGRARFVEDDGTIRDGVVDDVLPGCHLSFRWWPENDGQSATTRVSYDLEADDDGTRLTVTEQPLTAATPEARAGAAPSTGCDASWTDWDSRLFRCWARAVLRCAPMPSVVLVVRAIRRPR